jgi:hypothetical protein
MLLFSGLLICGTLSLLGSALFVYDYAVQYKKEFIARQASISADLQHLTPPICRV